MQEFCYGLGGNDKPVMVGSEMLVRIVILSGVANPFEKMVCITLNGKVFMRSIDGRKSSRAKPDLFIGTVGNPPLIIIA
jgi:hypothetical protein